MWITFRHRKESYTRNWRGEWWIGVRHDFPMDSYLIGLGVWGFCLRNETIWRLRGYAKNRARKAIKILARLFNRLGWNGRNRGVSDSDNRPSEVESTVEIRSYWSNDD